jgi:hypothetical protein
MHVDTEDIARRSERIAAAAAEARSITAHGRQMLGTAGGLAEATTSAAVIGFVAALARGLDAGVRDLERLAEALQTYADVCSDTERAVAGLVSDW